VVTDTLSKDTAPKFIYEKDGQFYTLDKVDDLNTEKFKNNYVKNKINILYTK
jgi:hypothetical protein